MRVEVNHSSVVIPEQEVWSLNVVQYAACELELGSGLQVFLGWTSNLRPRLCDFKHNEQRNAGMRGDCTLKPACVTKLHELNLQLPILRSRKRGNEKVK